MVIIKFLGPIGKDDLKIDVKNLNELKEILNEDKELKIWLKDCGVAVNDEIVTDANMQLKDGDVVAILAPVCGG
ncbi:hypothetical protein LMG7974_00023 [Campylobacter majalis]|uniref:MoaD/ThiS family protein n=1 Tax=Campylobacter majalis TaxID=2790656 RepID=A0ABM8Q1M5_9BACT|nr:MoaD/ThiS family protein [Campylobacter majalis]CAD7286666.1 hypothetical protein LMG7974_00023 [Campylobacter majalis]